MQGTKSTKLPSRMFLQQKIFIETLIEEEKPVVMDDKEDEFECREKLFRRGFHGSFGLSELRCNEHNQRSFTLMLLYKCYFSKMRS